MKILGCNSPQSPGSYAYAIIWHNFHIEKKQLYIALQNKLKWSNWDIKCYSRDAFSCDCQYMYTCMYIVLSMTVCTALVWHCLSMTGALQAAIETWANSAEVIDYS